GIRRPYLIREGDAQRVELIVLSLVEDVFVIARVQSIWHALGCFEPVPTDASYHKWFAERCEYVYSARGPARACRRPRSLLRRRCRLLYPSTAQCHDHDANQHGYTHQAQCCAILPRRPFLSFCGVLLDHGVPQDGFDRGLSTSTPGQIALRSDRYTGTGWEAS